MILLPLGGIIIRYHFLTFLPDVKVDLVADCLDFLAGPFRGHFMADVLEAEVVTHGAAGFVDEVGGVGVKDLVRREHVLGRGGS